MLEVSRVGVTESDEEIELSLELSIGGSYKKLEKLKQVEESGEEISDHKGLKNLGIVPRSGHLSIPESITGDQTVKSGSGGSEVVVVDLQRKRETQAWRRQEARRKREERLRKSGSNCCRWGGGGGSFVKSNCAEDDKMLLLETQQLQGRARDREIRENDALHVEGLARKRNVDGQCVQNNENGTTTTAAANNIVAVHSNFTFTNGSHDDSSVTITKPAAAVSFRSPKNVHPQVQLQLQYCSAPQNHNNHTVVSSSTSPSSSSSCLCPAPPPPPPPPPNYLRKEEEEEEEEEEEKNILDVKGKNMINISQPGVIDCGSFRPYSFNGNGNLKLKHDSTKICGTVCCGTEGEGERNNGSEIPPKLVSNGSPERTSSAVSDYRSTSRKGGSSSESGSHSSSNIGGGGGGVVRMGAQPETSIASDSKNDLGEVGRRSVDRWETKEVEVEASGNGNGNGAATNLKQKTEAPAAAGSSLILSPSGGGGDKPCLPRMPCVSTTGNGPNGKTVTGFLYRYTKKEVSIVCVCHGSSFSPAEFVEHAGGTDITNPLRHITMVPSCFRN